MLQHLIVSYGPHSRNRSTFDSARFGDRAAPFGLLHATQKLGGYSCRIDSHLGESVPNHPCNQESSSLILIQGATRCSTSRGRIFRPTLIILSHLFGTSVPSQHQNCFSKSIKFWIHSEHALRSSSTHRASRSRATESEWNGPVVCLPGPRVVILLLLVETEIVGERFDAVALQQ